VGFGCKVTISCTAANEWEKYSGMHAAERDTAEMNENVYVQGPAK
jgi:hypothetical protein